MNQNNIPFVFFGTPTFATTILDELSSQGFLPSCIVTTPDKPQGRTLQLTPSPVKVWALSHNIKILQPETITDEIIEALRKESPLVGIVAAYGKILPVPLLDLFPKGILNVHPSLLPKYRGSSPVEAAIVAGDPTTGVSIMLLDSRMDHGPILAQEELAITPHSKAPELETLLAYRGGALLAKMLTLWIHDECSATPQDDTHATYTKKITKLQGDISTISNEESKYRHFCAYYGWPGSYFIHPKAGRVKITDAELTNGVFIIKKVIPEGKREMSYDDFQKGYLN